MKLAVTIAALLSLLICIPAEATCTFNFRYTNGVLSWDPIPGGSNYRIVEYIGRQTFNHSTTKTSLALPHRVTTETTVLYVVTVDLAGGLQSLARSAANESTDSCTASFETKIPADPAFRKLTRKAILPIVGSSAGANGARFRTSLTLRGAASQRGRIVYHPAGRAALDSDPAIPYVLDGINPLVFPDIVESLGQSGIGSIDIIPDEGSPSRVPDMDVYLFNETPSGTFGTFSEPAFPFDFLHLNRLSLTMPDSRFRVNVGFRALTDLTLRVVTFGIDGRIRDFYDSTFPAGWMQMTTASDLARRPLVPGESMQLVYVTGTAIGFYTLTENATNDPTLVVPGRTSSNLGEYVD